MTVEFKGMTRDEVRENLKVGDFVYIKGGQFCAPSVDGGGDIKHMSVAEVLPELGVETKTGSGFWITHSAVNINCVESMPQHFMKVANGGLIPNNPTGLVGEIANDLTEVIPFTTINNLVNRVTEVAGEITSQGSAITQITNTVGGKADTRAIQALTTRIAQQGTPITELGVFRPNLEDRKVGKVRVELVDDGFPLALRELAKVMSWAQSAKGYKDHDWQNLPNPEQGLSGATSRHRSDFIIQRQVGGTPALECVDHESKISHKAHEAFGVLAQLELILRGVIK